MGDSRRRNAFEAPEAGPTWAERARLAPLEAVLDPADKRGGKNRLLDRLHKHALARAAPAVRGRRVLDFGCGTGRLSGWLVRHGADVDGVDVTPEMVAVAAGRVPRARFRTIDGSNVPFADGRFDLVVTAYVLQYYVHDDGQIPRELARVLQPGGRIVAIEQVTESELGRGGTRAAYEKMLTNAGFEGVAARPVRMSNARFLRTAELFPVLSRLPVIPWVVAREAARRFRRPLAHGEYIDVLFSATKAR